jgi:hypothetical protein
VLLMCSVGPVGSSEFVLHFLVDLNCLKIAWWALEVEGIRTGNQSSFPIASIKVSSLHLYVSLSDIEVVVSLGVSLELIVRE